MVVFTQKHPPVYGTEELLLPEFSRTGWVNEDCLGTMNRDGVVYLFCPCLRELGLGTCIAGFKYKENQPAMMEKLYHQGNLAAGLDFGLISSTNSAPSDCLHAGISLLQLDPPSALSVPPGWTVFHKTQPAQCHLYLQLSW